MIPYTQHLDVFALIVLGLLVEKHYVSRPSLFANTIALNIHFYKNPIMASYLIWYVDIGLVVGAIAIVAYAVEEQLPEEFYAITMLLYSSLPVALVIVWTL